MLPLLALAACVDPVAFGAKPDDGVSDTEAIQQAINRAITTGADVCLGAGVWTLGRSAHTGSLVLERGPVVIRGNGPTTVLRMSGDGHKHDWFAIQLKGARGVTIRDLTIDGLEAVDTDKQTHLIQVGPGSESTTIRSVTLGPMRRPDEPVGAGIGGDCIRLLGNPGHEVKSVVISQVTFTACDRSGITFQRALHSVLVTDSTFSGIGDTPIDFEPTGKGPIENVVLSNLEIDRTSDAQGAWAITIGNAHDLVLSGSHIRGGGVGMLDVDGVLMTDNDIEAGLKNVPLVQLKRRADHITISNNVLTRLPGDAPAPVIRALHNNGFAPGAIAVTDNKLVQQSAAQVIQGTSVRQLVVRGNTVDYAGGATASAIVGVDAIDGDMDEVRVEQNTVRGNAAAVLSAASRGHAIRHIDIGANDAPGVSPLRCNGPADVFGVVDSDKPARCRGRVVAPITKGHLDSR